jgi:hypothetical protein
MKLIKLKISRNRTPEKTSYSYPKEYAARKVAFGPIYESSLPKNFKAVVDRGDSDEYILFGVKDSDAPTFLACPHAKEVDYDEALSLGETWTEVKEVITDTKKVTELAIKAARGRALSAEEKAALDPDSPERGINKGRSFKEALDEFLAK